MLSYQVGHPYNAKVIVPAIELISELKSIAARLQTPIENYVNTALACSFLNYSHVMEMRDYNFLEEPDAVIDDVVAFTVSDLEGCATIPMEFDIPDVQFITLMVHDLYILLLNYINNECLLRGCKLEFHKERSGNIEFFYYHHFAPFRTPTSEMMRKLELNCFYIQEHLDYYIGA